MKINGDEVYLSIMQVVAATNDQPNDVKTAIYADVLAAAGWTPLEFVQYCEHLTNELLQPLSVNHSKWVN
jgi:hypothetical protein